MSHPPSPAVNSGSDRDLARAIDQALEDLLRFEPVRSSTLGYSAHDGAYGDHSAEGRKAKRRALGSHAHHLEERRGDDPDVELDRRLLLDELQVILRTEEDLAPCQRDPMLYVKEALTGVQQLLSWVPVREKLGALLGRLRHLPSFFATARRELVAEDAPPIWVETAIATARAGLSLLTESVPQAVSEAVGQGPLSVSLAAAAGEAALSLAAYANFLEGEVLPRAAGEFAAGDSYFLFLLHRRLGVLQGLAELKDLGEREVQRLSAALSETQLRIRPEAGSWQQCLAELDAEAPIVGSPTQYCQVLVERLRTATAALCPLPEAEALLVRETPPYCRPTVPFAAYWPPPVLHAEAQDHLTGVFWVTPESRPSRPELLLTCLHEAYPGHHLQFCHMARAGSRTRRVLGTPVFWEGWALYSESLLPELDVPDLCDDAARMHILRAQLWRALRVVLDVGLHCGGLSPKAAAGRLVTVAGLKVPQAEAEVRRYVRAPTQPSSYLLGYQAFCQLRAEATARGAFHPAAFHEAILRHGAIPLGYLHERLAAAPREHG